ncbi:MAG TPA: RNA methyltransferase [candidate division Zixibacteria bacterium]|nr:RNA methyltransferase [candidate division Zixibacteria bacterium]
MPTRKQEEALRQSLFKKTRKKVNFFVVEGERALSELLNSGWKALKIFAEPQKAHKIRSLIPFESTLQVEELSARKLAELAQTETPSGVLALVEKQTFTLEEAASEKRVLILDNLRDPGNVGTLLRTARSLGWGGVVLLKGTAELFSPKVVRSTAGALFHLKIVEGVAAEEAFDRLKKQNFTIGVADSHSGLSPEECRSLINQTPGKSLVLVIGSEAAGVSRGILSKADHSVKIPLSRGAESLNAAVSGGILMYLLRA